ncbi:MAG: hypothetical protein R6U19_08095 [Bacteroidales bacterium]
MDKKIFLVALFISVLSLGSARESTPKFLLIGLQPENITYNNNMGQFLDQKGLSETAIKNRIVAASQISFEELIQRKNYESRGIEDQASLLPSEFTELHKKERIDKLTKESERSFFNKLLDIFRKSQPKNYMAPTFSEDKKERIKTTLKQQECNYALVLHKYEIKKHFCGSAEMSTHYSIINTKGEVVLGEQQVFYVNITSSMQKGILQHLIQSSFTDTFEIIFNKL